jgi:hypothetical protein
MEISPRAHANLDRVSSATVSELHPLLGLLRRVLASPSFSVSFFFLKDVLLVFTMLKKVMYCIHTELKGTNYALSELDIELFLLT